MTPELVLAETARRLLDTSGFLLSSSGAGASKEAIDGLVAVETRGEEDEDEEGECAICLAADDQRKKAELPCGHRFHRGCVGKWLRVHGTCPTCRHQLPPMSPAARNDLRYSWFLAVEDLRKKAALLGLG
ncbi:E3 ubiquitin-protein ligase MPSR1 [Brachypodium distachyon]|nr:E3 ubiquitin-protein ligase MPSR1 [Brachypodium distachyon]|eukprot:XP_010230144.1 E3 ubiquitin-protein ligase MPSR1 [Brachypodium distachyon]